MKKCALFLIPVLFSSLVGCKQASLSKVDADIRKAKNLKFDEKYAEKITTPETDVDVYNEAYSVIYEKGVTTKSVVVRYDEVTYATDHIAETVALHTTYTIYQDYATQYNRTTKTENIFTDINKTSKNVDEIKIDSYYDDDRMAYFSHENRNGSHTLDRVDLSSYDASHIHNYISASQIEAFDDVSYTLGWCSFYQKKNGGYIGFNQGIDEDEEGTYLDRYQAICEFDKSFRLTKSVLISERFEKYDYIHNKATSKLRLVQYTHDIREVTYGNRKAESVVSKDVEKMFNKTFIYSGYASFDYLSDCDYIDYRTRIVAPNKVHLECFAYFNEFSSFALNVTPYIEVVTCDGMYEDGYHVYELDGMLSIKNSKYFKYYKGHLQYQMNRFTDAVWVKIDCKLTKDGKVKFESGSIEVKNRTELEAYMEGTIW